MYKHKHLLNICGRDRILISGSFGSPVCARPKLGSSVCSSLLKHHNNGASSGDLQTGNTKLYFGRTPCSASISAISKSMRRGDSISVSAINYKAWHFYVFIVEISKS